MILKAASIIRTKKIIMLKITINKNLKIENDKNDVLIIKKLQ
jgi:hypothetical protein